MSRRNSLLSPRYGGVDKDKWTPFYILLAFVLSFPAFQLSRFISPYGVQNYLVLIPVAVYYLAYHNSSFSASAWCGIMLFFAANCIAAMHGMISALQAVAYVLMLVFTVFLVGYFENRSGLKKILILVWIVNVVYALVQLIVYEVGGRSLMLHSTVSDGYVLTKFSTLGILIPYTFRYTGMFNENAPFTAYLMVMLSYFVGLYRSRLIEKRVGQSYIILSVLVIIVGGSKSALFLILYPFLNVVGVVFLIMIFISIFLLYLEVFKLEVWQDVSVNFDRIFKGRLGEFKARTELSAFGVGFRSSSQGESSHDFVGYNLSAYGYFGFTILLLSIVLIFYRRGSQLLIWTPALLSLLASTGSMAVQSWLIFFVGFVSLASLDNNKRKGDRN